MMTTSPTVRTSIPLERMQKDAVLAHVEPFTGASAERLSELARVAVRRSGLRGHEFMHQGAPPDGLFVILRGRVHLTRALDVTRRLIVTSLGPGDVFGENCVCTGASASCNAVCAAPSELLFIPAAALVGHVLREPTALLGLMALQGQRLQEVEGVASQLALCAVEERLGHRLVQLAARQGIPSVGPGGWVLTPVPTRSELGRMIGTCRETVSRALSAMLRDELIVSRGRHMIVTETLVKRLAT